MVEQAALESEGVFERKVRQKLLHETMDGITIQTDSLGTDLFAVPYDENLFPQVKERQRLWDRIGMPRR